MNLLQLGKIGDIISALGMLPTDQSNQVIVARDFASVLDGVSHVKQVVYDGHFSDLKGAIKWSKPRNNPLTVTQIYGKDFPIQKRTPSFQLDQWQRAGMQGEFLKRCPVFNRRDVSREASLLNGHSKEKFVLIATHSDSSPFAHANELVKLTTDIAQDRGIKVVHLAQYKAAKFYDLLALYDKAQLLVTVETAHVHLAKASRVPTIVMAADKPTRWHGSAWHPSMAMHCRYGDFDFRQLEIARTIRRCLEKTPLLQSSVIKTSGFGYNPSAIDYEGERLMAYRRHGNDWRTLIYITDGSHDWPVHFTSQNPELSYEDGHLFIHRGKLWISWVAARAETNVWKSVVCYGQLERTGDAWQVKQHIQPKHGSNNWQALEKNWCFFENDKQLFAIYQCNHKQTVLEILDDTVKMVHESPFPQWLWGDARGGCMVPWKGNLLRIFHSHSSAVDRTAWVYYIGAAIMEPFPPFKTIKVSSLPVISGDEGWQHDCRHWKGNVVFPGSVRVTENIAEIHYGRNDCECRSAIFNEKDLHL